MFNSKTGGLNCSLSLWNRKPGIAFLFSENRSWDEELNQRKCQSGPSLNRAGRDPIKSSLVDKVFNHIRLPFCSNALSNIVASI